MKNEQFWIFERKVPMNNLKMSGVCNTNHAYFCIHTKTFINTMTEKKLIKFLKKRLCSYTFNRGVSKSSAHISDSQGMSGLIFFTNIAFNKLTLCNTYINEKNNNLEKLFKKDSKIELKYNQKRNKNFIFRK